MKIASICSNFDQVFYETRGNETLAIYENREVMAQPFFSRNKYFQIEECKFKLEEATSLWNNRRNIRTNFINADHQSIFT